MTKCTETVYLIGSTIVVLVSNPNLMQRLIRVKVSAQIGGKWGITYDLFVTHTHTHTILSRKYTGKGEKEVSE